MVAPTALNWLALNWWDPGFVCLVWQQAGVNDLPVPWAQMAGHGVLQVSVYSPLPTLYCVMVGICMCVFVCVLVMVVVVTDCFKIKYGAYLAGWCCCEIVSVLSVMSSAVCQWLALAIGWRAGLLASFPVHTAGHGGMYGFVCLPPPVLCYLDLACVFCVSWV